MVTNYVAAKGKAVVINGGSFGRRWRDICHYYDLEEVTMDVPAGRDIDYPMLEALVERERPAVMLVQHHETSTGQLFDLKKLSEICHRHGVSLVVDAISTFLADPLDMDALGIDICLTSSQKGLNIQPGLSLVFISGKLAHFEWARRSYYFDFEENLHNLTRGQTPYSPATMLILQLRARIDMLLASGGVEGNIDRVKHRAQVWRELCREAGLEMPAEVPSNAITAFRVPRPAADTLFPRLIEQGYYIMPGGDPTLFRVSHMGLQSDQTLAQLHSAIINHIENS